MKGLRFVLRLCGSSVAFQIKSLIETFFLPSSVALFFPKCLSPFDQKKCKQTGKTLDGVCEWKKEGKKSLCSYVTVTKKIRGGERFLESSQSSKEKPKTSCHCTKRIARRPVGIGLLGASPNKLTVQRLFSALENMKGMFKNLKARSVPVLWSGRGKQIFTSP